ncbi:MAG TPA: sulfite exporter TauE/SafE family protein [Acidimicrobiales bacterium]|nr:sulfite exporter TauE/SafE family protein [Acidimicrobiales bacterium]
MPLDLDLAIALAGLLVGFTVGLTGMGGGALMTPIMVLFFKVSPLAAVSSDLVVSLIMKPVGGGVHLRRGTVRKDIALWLCIGSVPAAFAGVLLLKWLGAHNIEDLLKRALGLALLASAGSILLRRAIDRRRAEGWEPPPVVLKRSTTLLVGVIGGLVVGMTSVGSGSLIIVMLLFVYPGLRSAELVGTDLVQAIPLVGSAALGHLFFGDVRLALTASLLLGALPGVYVGARLSAHAPDRVVRPALFVVLLTSGLKLVQVI